MFKSLLIHAFLHKLYKHTAFFSHYQALNKNEKDNRTGIGFFGIMLFFRVCIKIACNKSFNPEKYNA